MQYFGRRWGDFASYSSAGYANEHLRRSTTVFAFVTLSLVIFSRRKVEPALTWLNFRRAMLKYGRRSRVEFKKKFFWSKTSGNTNVRYARRRSKK